MEQILLAYGIPKETVAAITILYRNTKVKVRSPDGDTEYFDIVAGVLQGDTLAPYIFIICLDYVLRTSIDKIKENGFELTKKRSRRYPATTIYIYIYIYIFGARLNHGTLYCHVIAMWLKDSSEHWYFLVEFLSLQMCWYWLTWGSTMWNLCFYSILYLNIP